MLSIIVPCYNEEKSLPSFFSETEKIIEKLQIAVEYIFVNDGSADDTLKILRQLQAENASVHFISFSRNFGKEAAIYAGLKESRGEFVTLMDADLQDPPELLIEMFEKIQMEDVDCVAARRSDRSGESKIVSFFSNSFYSIMNKISSVPVVNGVRDFRLMKRQVVEALLELSEYSRFSKGLFTWVGFHTEYVDYTNRQRIAGETKWSFWSKLNYAIEGFVSFSEAPLNISLYVGLVTEIITIILAIVLIIRQLIFHNSVSGWTSMTVIILICFGFTLLMLGVIGKYISKIFLESKNRPIYIIKEKK